MARLLEWLLAALGVVSCLVGAALIVAQQPDDSLWPLPGLILMQWGVLGLIGFGAVAVDNLRQLMGWPEAGEGRVSRWDLLTSAVCGALIALMVMGTFSIGPLVLVAVLAFGAATVLAALRKGRQLRVSLLIMFICLLLNFAVLTVLVATL